MNKKALATWVMWSLIGLVGLILVASVLYLAIPGLIIVPSDKVAVIVPAPVITPGLPQVLFIGVTTLPLDLAKNQGIINNIVITFSEAMNSSTVNENTFLVKGPNNLAITGVITSDTTKKIWTFNPTDNLKFNTKYDITVTTGAKGVSGNALITNFIWSFTTSYASGGGSSGGGSTPAESPVLTTIALSLTSVNFTINSTRQLTVTKLDQFSSPIAATINYTTSNSSVATVSSSGLITAIAAGNATITARNGTINGTIIIYVTSSPKVLTTIILLPESANLNVGSIQQLNITKLDQFGSNMTATINYTTSNSSVATVSSLGVVTGIAVGNATITARNGTINDTSIITVIAGSIANPTAPVLGNSGRFIILASQKVTTTVGSVISNGDIGIEDQARSYYEGFTAGVNPGEFNELTTGLSYAHDDTDPALIPSPFASTIAFIDQVRTDLGVAYTYLAADPNPGAPTQVCPIELGELTLTRGVYKTDSDVTIQTGDLHLDAQGDSTSVWIFSIGGTLTTGAPGGNIVLDNGALAKNVYWRTAGITTIGAGKAFKGNVFAWEQVNALASADITGRLFSVNEQVTLISDTVTKLS